MLESWAAAGVNLVEVTPKSERPGGNAECCQRQQEVARHRRPHIQIKLVAGATNVAVPPELYVVAA